MGIMSEHGANQIVKTDSLLLKVLTGVATAILAAMIIGIFQFSGWQGRVDQRVTAIEQQANRNQDGISDLTKSINDNTRVTSVLAERMKAIIERMDERERRRHDGQ